MGTAAAEGGVAGLLPSPGDPMPTGAHLYESGGLTLTVRPDPWQIMSPGAAGGRASVNCTPAGIKPDSGRGHRSHLNPAHESAIHQRSGARLAHSP